MTQTSPDWRQTDRALRHRTDFGELAPGGPPPTIKGLAGHRSSVQYPVTNAVHRAAQMPARPDRPTCPSA